MTLGRKGTILVASLWILAILSILAMGIGFRISIEARLCKYNLDRMRALYLARAGLYRAEELLTKQNPGSADSLRECGITLGNSADTTNTPEKYFKDVRLGDGSFTVGYGNTPGVSDEERRFNLNTTDAPTLMAFLDSVDKDSDQKDDSDLSHKDIAAAIVDWRTSGDNAGTFSSGFTTSDKDEYYQSLPHPYGRKKGPFCAVEELLLVKGVTPRIFNLIKDYVTVYGDGKININTASVEVISAIGLKDIASQIVDTRNGADRLPGTKDDVVIPDADVSNFIGKFKTMDQKTVNALIPIFKGHSEYFRIESRGSLDKSKVIKRIVCIVQKQKDTTKGSWPILKSYREY